MSDEQNTMSDAPDMELPMPKGFDHEKIADLREQKSKVMEKIGKVIGGGKVRRKGEKVFFSFYTPPESKKREIGETWMDEDGKEWVQRNGYVISIPKIDREELELCGALMPRHCPKCGRELRSGLNKKMWRLNGFCMDCTAEWETQMMIEGKYHEYERQRIMSNVRAFYYDVMNGLNDYISGLDTTYVNEFGDIERWDRVNRPMLKSLILNDLKLLAADFEKNFGEPLEKDNVVATDTGLPIQQLV